jgi:hypothetical protein
LKVGQDSLFGGLAHVSGIFATWVQASADSAAEVASKLRAWNGEPIF